MDFPVDLAGTAAEPTEGARRRGTPLPGTRRSQLGDLSGAVADLGVLVPLAAALVVVNGLHPGPLLMGAGALSLGAGFAFRIPFPVQPLKALSALAIAGHVSPEVIHAAGLEIGLCLIVLSLTRLADRLASLFTKPVIRSLQLAVGSLLILSAYELAADPPEVFVNVPPAAWGVTLAAATLAVVALAARLQWHAVAALLLAGGVAVGWTLAAPDLGPLVVHVPTLSLPRPSVYGIAFVLLVIPQLPLTYGNAVVGVSDLAREHFGHQARVSPGRVALSAGLGNVAAGIIGGMPMCHGSSGLSAHVRLGARTRNMNILLGSALLILGLVFSQQVLTLFGILPAWALAGFLAYAGVRHAMLVLDLRGHRLALAVAAGAIGVVTGNLAYTTAAALVVEQGARAVDHLARRRDRRLQAREGAGGASGTWKPSSST